MCHDVSGGLLCPPDETRPRIRRAVLVGLEFKRRRRSLQPDSAWQALTRLTPYRPALPDEDEHRMGVIMPAKLGQDGLGFPPP